MPDENITPSLGQSQKWKLSDKSRSSPGTCIEPTGVRMVKTESFLENIAKLISKVLSGENMVRKIRLRMGMETYFIPNIINKRFLSIAKRCTQERLHHHRSTSIVFKVPYKIWPDREHKLKNTYSQSKRNFNPFSITKEVFEAKWYNH